MIILNQIKSLRKKTWFLVFFLILVNAIAIGTSSILFDHSWDQASQQVSTEQIAKSIKSIMIITILQLMLSIFLIALIILVERKRSRIKKELNFIK